MSNDTSADLYIYISYIVESTVIGPANLIVAVSILWYEGLRTRKEYILLVALSLADALNMLAYACAGVYRLRTYLEQRSAELVPFEYCLTLPHTFLWNYSDHIAQLMLVIISVDRLLCVAFPLYYIKLTTRYAKRMGGVAYASTFLIGSLGFGLSYRDPPDRLVTIMCDYVPDVSHYPEPLPKLFQYYYLKIPPIYATLSIFLFALVLPVYVYKKGKLSAGESEEQKLRQQRKITKSLGISCCCTLCLLVIPYNLANHFYFGGRPLLAYGLWVFSLNNGLANVFIYELRHVEMRVALRSLFRCKELPPNLEMWNLGAAPPQAHAGPQQAWPVNHNQEGV